MRNAFPREFYIPNGSVKVSDKLSDAVAYLYTNLKGAPCAAVFFGKQSKPVTQYRYRSEAEREKCVARSFANNREHASRIASRKTERKAEAMAFAQKIEVGDIFHYSFGYDETHHVYHEVVEIKGRHAIVRRIGVASEPLGYDDRHRDMPQSGAFVGEPKRVLIQDGRIAIDCHYHASLWNTRRVAGVPVGPSYVGGGMH